MADLIGVMVGGVIGVLGSVVAQYVSRHLRTQGELHCEVNAWTGGNIGAFKEELHFEVKVFNEKDVGIGLWDISIVFCRSGEEPVSFRPKFGADGRSVDLLNIPSRIPMSWTMGIEAQAGPLLAVRKADKVEFRGRFPGGQPFQKDMTPQETEENKNIEKLRIQYGVQPPTS
jgi:hypothetical protein